ncbi:MAG: hypothetical protein IKT46_06640 [Clostridia bacterium]|nr:hypothetical protein [Clostridia bacterium]
MKKTICVFIILSVLSLTVFANPNMQADIGNINVPMATPVIDGVINAGEGWSEGVYAYKDLMATFGNCNEILQSFYLYYAYDNDGIYYAADITDNSFVLSTGEDDIDNVKNDFNIKDEVVYGYNGDIFTFTVDPMGAFLNEGYMSNTDYNAWYSVGIFEGNVCRMYRAHNRSGDITSDVKLKGAVTDAGWRFEAFIPWDFISTDAEDMSYGDISLTPAQLCASGASHRAMAIYMDRFVDPESGDIATFQRFATCGFTLSDGLLGYMSSGMCLKAYGITLTLGGTGDGADTTKTEDTTASSTESTTDTSSNKKDTKATTVKTTTKKATTGTATGGNAAQTFDLGIAIGIGVAIAAVIAFIFVKKKL